MYTCSVTALVRCWLALAVCQTSARDLLDQHVQRIIGNLISEDSHSRDPDIQKDLSTLIKKIQLYCLQPHTHHEQRIQWEVTTMHAFVIVCYRSQRNTRVIAFGTLVLYLGNLIPLGHIFQKFNFFQNIESVCVCIFFHFLKIKKIHPYCWDLRFKKKFQLECVYAESL